VKKLVSSFLVFMVCFSCFAEVFAGNVVAVGWNNFGRCNVQDWQDIVQVTVSKYHTVGLKTDGTVVATGSNDNHRCDVQDWRDIVQLAAGDWHTVGLKKDGTVVAVGYHDKWGGVEDWANIVQVAASMHGTVGLKTEPPRVFRRFS
jgi:alpha-tubulin suppressor-like RCC1 family protein